MSQQHLNPLSPEAAEELKLRLRAQEASSPLPLDQLLRLKASLREEPWQLFLTYLASLERLVDERLHNTRTTWEATCFERGRWDTIRRLQRIDEDLTRLIEAKKETPIEL